MTIDKDSLIENLQGIILAQTHTMAMMFKVLVRAELMDGRSFIEIMRSAPMAGEPSNDVANDILAGQAASLERWMDDMSDDSVPMLTVIDGGLAGK